MARPRLKVEVPKPEADRPELGRVGIIAGVGFAIGLAWPWLAGVKLVPSPPTDDAPELAAVASASGSAAASAPPAADPPASLVVPAETKTHEETVKLVDMKVTACRNAAGKKLKDCDKVGFEASARPHLLALAACQAAQGTKQTLSLGFELDFDKGAITDVFAGKSTTYSKEDAHALVECAKKEFETVKLEGVDHEHTRYTTFFFLEFLPPGTILEGKAPEEETAEASGLATVGWDVAVVRDEPENGKIVTRLRYGTRVSVSARRGSWYEVKYDAKGSKGWVHKNALGL